MAKIKFTKDTLMRMLRTFAQAAIAYLAVNIATVDFTAEGEVVKATLKGLIIATIAAGIAAVMNLHKDILPVFEEVVEDELTTEDE